ncbi:MAG: hypothetical protein IJE16_00835 [Ruminococcus sp.]|nr:hypothetical protein [Ruminococcus sp.]
MKKTALILCIIFCVLFTTACSGQEDPTTETLPHSIPATQPVVLEPEWAEIDCDISLVDADTSNILLMAEDFETFAVVGTTDEDSYIVLKTTSDAVSMMQATSYVPTNLQLVVNGETKADITIDFSSFNGEITFGEDMTYESLCELASIIRGLF